jgi:hypothetical protein
MGCDIHLYIEYKSKEKDFGKYKYKQQWQSFGGKINPGRNYAMFALMANVRNYYNDGKLPVLIEPRGMPADSSFHSTSDNRCYISNGGSGSDVPMETAKRWVENGSSQFIYGVNGEPYWVTNPDWHSHSWLMTDEFENIISKYLELETGWHKERVGQHNNMVREDNIQPDSWMYAPPDMNIEPTYQAILASMKRFEELGYYARIVFWFDN